MSKHTSRNALWITIAQAGLLGVVAGLGGYLLLTVLFGAPTRAHANVTQGMTAQPPQGPPPGGPGGFGGRGFPGGQERKVVAQFDKNGDKRLDAAERKAARAWLSTEGAGGFRGFGGRRGGPGRGRGVSIGTPGPRLTPADVKSFPSAPLYSLETVRTIFLQFENEDWEQELAAFHNTDVEVPATAIVDGRTFTDVGVHFRGASSFMMVPEGSKRSLNLSLDFVHDKQELAGYRTLNLLNANSDPTFVRTVVYSDIANRYIPAPRANYMKVVINGESWGVYVNAQQFNKDFTRDFFNSTKGARWKVPGSPGGRAGMEYLGSDPAAYKRLYEIKSRDDPKSWTDLIEMFRVLNETPADALEARLAPLLDIDGVLKFLALEVALVNSDGYWARASDYSIYQDEKGRFHLVPHDMNEGLADESGGRGGAGGPPTGFGPGGPQGGRGPMMFGRATVTLDPLIGLDDPGKPLRSKLLAVPALRERYLGYVREIAAKWLDWKTLGPFVQKAQATIAADVAADTRKLYSTDAFTAGIDGDERSLRTFVERRRAFLLEWKK